MKKYLVQYGFIIGGLLTFFMWASYLVWQDNVNIELAVFVGIITMLISFTFLPIGLRKHRNSLGGQMSFKEGFKSALTIALIASVCYVLSWMIYYQLFGQIFMEDYQAQLLINLKEQGLSDIEIGERKLDLDLLAEKYKSPFFRIGKTFMEVLPMGIIFSFFSALILKRT